MSLLENVTGALTPETAASWEAIAPLVPEPAYLIGGTALAVRLHHRVSRDLDFFFHEPIELRRLRADLEARGEFAATVHTDDTLNGQFNETNVQFLSVAGQTLLLPPEKIGGIRVARMPDIFATKIKVIADRAELRDYFDLMCIEQQTGHLAEEGLALYLTRYGDDATSNTFKGIVMALGHLDDVLDDDALPVSREIITNYWKMRQPQLVRNISREPVAPILPAASPE